MKKIFLGLVAVGLMATSANAWWINGGIVTQIYVVNPGGIQVTVKTDTSSYSRYLEENPETERMYDALLSVGNYKKVNLNIGSSGKIVGVVATDIYASN